jgi:hypothetical protein
LAVFFPRLWALDNFCNCQPLCRYHKTHTSHQQWPISTPKEVTKTTWHPGIARRGASCWASNLCRQWA